MAYWKQTGKRRTRRQKRVRNRIFGSAQKPRLAVFRSNKHMYAQLIDDYQGHTLASASTQSPEIREKVDNGGNTDAAKLVGELIGQRAKEAGIDAVVLDRRHYKYHGRVKTLAEAVRETGVNV